MSSKEIEIDGRPLSSLRVVDLKDELQKRGLSKSGAKKELELRLRKHLQIEQARVSAATTVDDEELPNISMRNEHEENPFIKEYLASQAELFHSQKVIKKQFDEEKKRESEASADESTTNKMGQEIESPTRSESESPTNKPPAVVVVPPPTASAILQSPPAKLKPQMVLEKETTTPSPPAKRELRTRGGKAPEPPPTVVQPVPAADVSPRRSSLREKKDEVVVAVESPSNTSLTEVVVEKRRRLSSRGSSATGTLDDSPLKEVIVEPSRTRKLSARNLEQKESEKEGTSSTIPPAAAASAQTSKNVPSITFAEKSKSESPTKRQAVVDPVLPPSPSPSPPSVPAEIQPTAVISTPQKVIAAESPVKKTPEKISVVEEEIKKSPEKVIKEIEKIVEKTKSPEREKVAVVSPIKRIPVLPTTKPSVVDEKCKESSSSSTSSGSSTSDGDSEDEPEKPVLVEVKKSPVVIEKIKEKELPLPQQPPPSVSAKPKLTLPSEDDEIELHPDEMELSSFDTPPKKEKEKIGVIVKEKEKVIVEHKKLITKAPEPKPSAINKIKDKSPSPSKPSQKPLIKPPPATTTATTIPSVPAPISKRLSQTIESMDQETLDYGDLEEEVIKPKEKYSWTRRVLNLKNILKKATNSSSDAKKEEKKPTEVEPKSKPSSLIQRVNTETLNKYYTDLKLVPEKELEISPSTEPESSKAEEADEEGKINKKRRISIKSEEATQNTEFNGFNRTIVNDLPTASTSTSTTKPSNLKRQISMVPLKIEADETSKVPTNLVLITNLVRPFTLPQLKELLGRTGDLQDVWLDKIKSKCIAKYTTSEEAFETRAALHGIKWPSSNFKELAVDYSTEELLEKCKNDIQFSSSRTITVEKINTEDIIKNPDVSISGQTREWDMGKKRSRSRSPTSKTSKRTRRSRSNERAEPPQQQGKALDELFKKTNALPQIYWLPLTPKQIEEKEEMRRKRLEEREIRLKEIREMQIPSRPLRFR